MNITSSYNVKLLDTTSAIKATTKIYQKAVEYLIVVADRLRRKNQADFIVANDLSKIGGGKHWAMIVGADGVVAECETKDEIASTIVRLTM